MRRREFLIAATVLGPASLIATRSPSVERCPCVVDERLHLYEVEYHPCDWPNVYASTSREAALAAYQREVRPEADHLTIDVVTEIPDDELYSYYEDLPAGSIRSVRRAGEIAAESPRDVCIFCDPHYC